MKRIIAVWTAFILVILMAAGLAEGGADPSAAPEWQTDIRLSITREKQLMQEAGMDLGQWDEAVAQQKQAGLGDPVSREAILAENPDAGVYEEDGKVYQLGVCSLYGSVTDTLGAYRLAYRLAGVLGGSSMTELVLRSKLTMNEITVYSFAQICDGQEILGAVLKIALDGNNEVTAVFSSLDPEASREQKRITREEAEAEAAARASGAVLTEYTDREIVMPVGFSELLNLELDDDPVPNDLAWIVYTACEEPDYPYLAHYIRVDGTYLKSLPVKEPGSAEALCGYRQKDVFAGMTADTYTGEITDINGNTRTVTIPVMRSEADGCWYLGDVNRRIVFAEYYDAGYGEDHDLVLVKNEENSGWDQEDVYAFHNYLRAWQFYADMGWTGADGEGTPVVILRNMCYSDRSVCENACSLGLMEGWQGFAYASYLGSGDPVRLVWGLDVMAHEFTHTFTGTVMNQNLYENDYGAINEAMSDIMGNLIEYICRDTDDTEWLIGENAGISLRNMSDPESFGQPLSVWGLYYAPQVDKPNTVNDRGGVHYNSSLLNLIAYRLCADAGMSYGEAVRLWVLTALGLTPRTDYLQMSALLNWAIEQSGEAGKYQAALDQVIAETRIGSTDMPESLPAGQKLIRLELPDTPAFRDNKDWCLYITQLDVKTKEELRAELLKTVKDLLESKEKREEFAGDIRQIIRNLKLESADAEHPSLILKDEEKLEISTKLLDELVKLLQKQKEKIVENEMTLFSWEEKGSGVIPAVIYDKETVYMLLNISKGGAQIEKIVYLIGSSWYDLTDFMMNDQYNGEETNRDKLIKLTKELGKQGLRNLLGSGGLSFGKDQKTGSDTIQVENLPTAGLEYIELNGQ